ncbi:glycosylphosphatidylinositol anchor biosynthesis [Neodidymelliopsis sp. IMI 364377]|nr:glycosylphosphatidylinositol anchor biosynthesis [Neodidymelliopsis sp. IMI 364377]
MESGRLLDPLDAFFKPSASGRRRRDASRSTSRRSKSNYKKLLWFKQPFPDNYTDEKTFLDHLQRNPRLQPYEFWSLMADTTIIVQHLASVAIFCCCFVAIIQGNVSPLSVVGWATMCTVLAWILWDRWQGQELDVTNDTQEKQPDGDDASETLPESIPSPPSRYQQRMSTVKSAVLIYAALLGLSPILKSLTKSTTSDSIWAISTWLLMMNVAFFDYSSGPGAQ